MTSEHRDPIEKLGAYGVCPNCGRSTAKWDPATDISRCSCGFSNRQAAIENYEHRIKNGEAKK